MIINKINFNSWVQFTQNIEDRILNPHIENVQIERINPVLGDNLYNAILNISETNPIAWNAATPYVIGNYATFSFGSSPNYTNDKVYKAIANSTNEALTNIAFWVVDPLATFWFNYVRPWAVFETFHRFLIWQGINVVQYSIVFMDTDEANVIDGQTRAYIMANVEKSAGIRKSKMLNFLKDLSWTFDTVVYSVDLNEYKTKNTDNRVRAVGKRKYFNN